jgi:hypothetical protein
MHRIFFSADQQAHGGNGTSLIKGDVYKWGMLMAGALAAAPPLIVRVPHGLLHRRLTQARPGVGMPSWQAQRQETVRRS